MKIKVTVSMDKNQVISRRGLGADNNVRKHLASTVKRLSAPYVPMQSGMLRNTAEISSDGKMLTYTQPYAHYQYYGQVMGPNVLTKDGWISIAKKGGKQYTGAAIKNHVGGPYWDKRMMADRREDVVRAVQKYIGKLAKK